MKPCESSNEQSKHLVKFYIYVNSQESDVTYIRQHTRKSFIRGMKRTRKNA